MNEKFTKTMIDSVPTEIFPETKEEKIIEKKVKPDEKENGNITEGVDNPGFKKPETIKETEIIKNRPIETKKAVGKITFGGISEGHLRNDLGEELGLDGTKSRKGFFDREKFIKKLKKFLFGPEINN